MVKLKPTTQEVLLHIILTCLLIEVGFLLGREFPKPQYVISTTSLYETHKMDVEIAATTAMRRLFLCAPFAKHYPKRYYYFMLQREKGFGISYNSDTPDNVYAYCIGNTSNIFLGPAFFEQSRMEQVRTIAHEMLHASGFPNHKKDKKGNEIDAGDPTYMMTDACFPELPREAL